MPKSEKCENTAINCTQKEANEEIRDSQKTMELNQKSIEEKIDVMNGSLSRIFKLYERLEKRLNDGDKRFSEIQEFIVEKKATNGVAEKEAADMKHDIKEGDEKRVTISERVTRVEETKADKEDVANIRTDIKEVKTLLVAHCKDDDKTTKKEEKEEDRSYSRQEKMMMAGLTVIILPLFFLIILQLIKTFVWHF